MAAVEIELRGPVLWARISRPEHGNACDAEVMEGLERWCTEAATEPVRAAVLTGSGASFCAGADLREAVRLIDDREGLLAFLGRGRDLVAAIEAVPVPTVAAVNGAAFAGGLELALACDIRLAAASARLGDRHLAAGQIPGWGSSALLPRAIGQAAAALLLLEAEPVAAERAESIGLVAEVLPDAELEARAEALAASLAGRDPGATARLLRLVRAWDGDFAAAREREWAALVQHVDDPEVAAAVRRFLA